MDLALGVTRKQHGEILGEADSRLRGGDSIAFCVLIEPADDGGEVVRLEIPDFDTSVISDQTEDR